MSSRIQTSKHSTQAFILLAYQRDRARLQQQLDDLDARMRAQRQIVVELLQDEGIPVSELTTFLESDGKAVVPAQDWQATRQRILSEAHAEAQRILGLPAELYNNNTAVFVQGGDTDDFVNEMHGSPDKDWYVQNAAKIARDIGIEV